MILPASSPQPTNGASPFDWRREQLGSIDRMMLNAGIKTAKKAVYGNCTSPSSYAAQGINLMSDIAAAPSPSDVIAANTFASSFVASNGGSFSDQPVNTSPLDGTQGYPTPTPIPPQTTPQGLVSPVIPGATMPLRRPQTTCPVNAQPQLTKLALPPAGQAPNWGSAFQTVPGPQSPSSSAFDIFDWVKANPWAALLIAAGGVAIFSSGGGR